MRAALLFFLLPALAWAYQSPGAPAGFVNDLAGLLDDTAQQMLEQKLSEFERATGVEIAVVTVATLGGDTIENFANELFQDWEIGKKGQDNGALLLVARDERELRIEVGYGLEPVLTDAQSKLIIDKIITPQFKTGDYQAGIEQGVMAMMQMTKGEVLTDNRSAISSLPWDGILSGFFLLVIPFLLWFVSLLARSKSWWAGGVVGGVIGLIVALLGGLVFAGLIALGLLIPLGLLFDYLVSRAYQKSKTAGRMPPWWAGGSGFKGIGHGGGFGGVGGTK